MLYVRLFENENTWDSLNDIREVQCSDYAPISVDDVSNLLGNKINIACNNVKVYGCFVTCEGEVVFSQRFEDVLNVVGAGSVCVDFS